MLLIYLYTNIFMQNPREIIQNPEEELTLMMLNAGIGDTLESLYVANTISDHFRNTKDIIPMITEHRGLALASRCLVSVGFFRDRLNHLTNFRGNPSPGFYSRVGVSEYIRADKPELAEHFYEWTDFMYETFKKKCGEFENDEKNLVQPATAYSTSVFHKAYQDQRAWKAPGKLENEHILTNLN